MHAWSMFNWIMTEHNMWHTLHILQVYMVVVLWPEKSQRRHRERNASKKILWTHTQSTISTIIIHTYIWMWPRTFRFSSFSAISTVWRNAPMRWTCFYAPVAVSARRSPSYWSAARLHSVFWLQKVKKERDKTKWWATTNSAPQGNSTVVTHYTRINSPGQTIHLYQPHND